MRLTLRTMLAYLDGILDADDAQDIGNKINESAFASDLIHRIRDLLRRPSVSVPGMEDQEPSLGPNAVAEYLDNTLPPNRVTEFEKICLESDIHLAEVAASHQILALVLGEPAEIDPASRQRMYDMPDQIAASDMPLSSDSQTEVVLPPPLPAFSVSSLDINADTKPRKKPAVPEYLREPIKKYRWISVAASGLIVVFVIVVLLMALGQFEPGTTFGNILVSVGLVKDNRQIASETTNATAVATTPAKKADATKPAKPGTDDKSGVTETKSSTPPAAKASIASKPAPDSVKLPGAEPSSTPIAPAKDKTEITSTTDKATASGETTPAETKSETNPLATIAPSETKSTTDKDQIPGKIATKEATATTEQPSESEQPGTAEVAGVAKATDEKSVPASERMGRYISDEDQLLLKTSGETNDWQRVAKQDLLTTNEKLLAMPTFRPGIAMASVNLSMIGGTELELIPGSTEEPVGIKIHFGRIVTMPLANADTQLRIVIGERTGVITFVDPEAEVAIEVRRHHTPGQNPETEPAKFSAEFFITKGHVIWNEKGQKPLDLATGPMRFTIEDQSQPNAIAVKDFPKWITSEPMGILERRASATLAQEMISKPPTRPAQRGLMELAEHRQKETRLLAIRCLGYLGYFDPMISVLDDATFKQEWSDNFIDPLREAVARDPQTAAAVRKSLESRYPNTAAEMYRMLWGYSDKDLAAGEDGTLVKSLDSEILAMRVLSFWNLKEITGLGLYYKPEVTAAKRQQPVIRWKQRLDAKEIRVKTPEEKAGNAAKENTPPAPAAE